MAITAITIGTRTATTGELTHPELFGALRLDEALHVKPIAIPALKGQPYESPGQSAAPPWVTIAFRP